MVIWLLSFIHGLSLLVRTTCVSVSVCVRKCERVSVCLLRMWQVSVEIYDSFCLLYVSVSVCALSRARCQYSSLSFLFSPLYHHDNLLTPAQPHTANISLPSPSDMFIFLTPSPYTLSLSLSLSSISTLYSAFISCLQCLLLLPISGFLQFPLCLHATFT